MCVLEQDDEVANDTKASPLFDYVFLCYNHLLFALLCCAFIVAFVTETKQSQERRTH